jgi:hypothetical protein
VNRVCQTESVMDCSVSTTYTTTSDRIRVAKTDRQADRLGTFFLEFEYISAHHRRVD